jgi:hypothetical protein
MRRTVLNSDTLTRADHFRPTFITNIEYYYIMKDLYYNFGGLSGTSTNYKVLTLLFGWKALEKRCHVEDFVADGTLN